MHNLRAYRLRVVYVALKWAFPPRAAEIPCWSIGPRGRSRAALTLHFFLTLV